EGGLSDTEILYSETQSRILVTVSPANAAQVEEIFGSDAACIGRVIGDRKLVVASTSGGVLIDQGLDELKKAWKAPLEF
ncbi:MAG TPA: AIR synthase-related protein, partial [Deltaproteobacteria bacterium]|nr:AIR synthase-related protein [Deltaproteobacteria bacterium]